MAKRGENIRKRKDGRWEARYEKGRKPNGHICYGYVYAYKYSEVKAKRNSAIIALAEQNNTLLPSVSEVTFHDLFNEWKTSIRYAVKESSYYLYDIIIEKHLRPYFGGLKVLYITQPIVQEFFNKKIDEKLSPSYIHTISIVFKNILKLARQRHYLPDELPKYYLPKVNERRDIFTSQEWKLLESFLKTQNNNFSFGILLCMYTGIRIGELSGLRWEDFDMENEQLLIRRTVYRTKNPHYDETLSKNKTIIRIDSPKSKTSRRNIPLPIFLMQSATLFMQPDNCYVLTGTPECMEPRSIQRKYKKILKKCGLRSLTLHSLRHNFATIALEKGFDYKSLSEILGHASVNTTLNIYVHSNLEQKRRNMELFFQ